MLDRAWRADWSELAERLVDVRGLFVVGRGLGLGIAQEAALKFKETCGLHAEAFSAAEIRHGPLALAGPGFPVLIFRQSDETEDSLEALAADVIARGGEVLMAGPPAPGVIALPSEEAHPAIEPMLQILSFYRAVNALAVARGLDPDAPPHSQGHGDDVMARALANVRILAADGFRTGGALLVEGGGSPRSCRRARYRPASRRATLRPHACPRLHRLAGQWRRRRAVHESPTVEAIAAIGAAHPRVRHDRLLPT